MATALASRHGQRLLIEQQAAGTMYRLLFLDGELLGVVRRRSAKVVGDGRSTVRELIAAENRQRLAARGGGGFSLLRVDLDCLLMLRATGRSMRSVPRPGENVTLKVSSSDNRREDNETVRAPLAPELVAEAAQAAQRLELRLAGVDIVTSDPHQPLRHNGGVILEVNCTPGLAYHYHVGGPPTPVAVPGASPAARRAKFIRQRVRQAVRPALPTWRCAARSVCAVCASASSPTGPAAHHRATEQAVQHGGGIAPRPYGQVLTDVAGS